MEKFFMLLGFAEILLVVFMQWQVYIKKIIITFSISSFILAVFLFILGYYSHENILILIAILTIIVRTLFIPIFMLKTLKRDKWRVRESAPVMGTASSIICSILIVVLGFIIYITTIYEFTHLRAGAIPLAIILQGIFLIISRRNTMIQLVGYMVMENGVLMFGAFLFPGLPFIFEAGIILDLIGIVMIGSLVNRLRENYVPDILEDLEELKG